MPRIGTTPHRLRIAPSNPMSFELYAVVREPGSHKATIHLHGTYATKILAQWWAINATGVWYEGVNGPKVIFYKGPTILRWEIREIP